MAGVVALSLLAAQPLLAAGYLPGLHKRAAQRLHLWLGGALIICAQGHMVGCYCSEERKANVRTPITPANLVSRPLAEKKNLTVHPTTDRPIDIPVHNIDPLDS